MSQVRILLGAPVSLQKVGARGFEPPTSCAQGRRATRLRYAPLKAEGKYTVSGRGSSLSHGAIAREPLQDRPQPRERTPAMRQAILLGRVQLRQRLSRRFRAEPAVVGERPEPALPRADDRLLRRVVVEGRARLVGRGEPDLPQREQLEHDAGEDLADLDELPGVGGRNQQLHFANAPAIAASCFWCSSARPFCASATISASWPGVNGRFSAVPCTSSSSPAALPTTFMSTSAAKSSS